MNDLRGEGLFSVKGKIVLITGGGSGIGKMMAHAFAANGAARVYIAARKEGQLREAAEEINKVVGSSLAEGQGVVRWLTANVGTKAGCLALVDAFKAKETKLHVLINNSGVTWGGQYDDFDEQKGWDNVFGVNVKSIFYMTAALTPLLSKDATNVDPGRVINISSTASIEPRTEGPLGAPGTGTWSYQPSKAAVNHLTSSLAVKLGPENITVNAILPGLFPSKMTAYGIRTAGAEVFAANQPTGRYGAASDIGGLAVFLSSPASAHITGNHIVIDGGSRYNAQGVVGSVKL